MALDRSATIRVQPTVIPAGVPALSQVEMNIPVRYSEPSCMIVGSRPRLLVPSNIRAPSGAFTLTPISLCRLPTRTTMRELVTADRSVFPLRAAVTGSGKYAENRKG
jgi:hypothetical protein